MWSDEVRVTCGKCSKPVTRQGMMSCLEWCKMGRECVGEEAYNRFMTNHTATVREQLDDELHAWFGPDSKRIDHAHAVLCFAEELLQKESGDWHIVVPASILHDVGIKVAEEKYHSSAGNYQEVEGPPVARKILLKIGMKKEDIEEICAIIAHHHSPSDSESQNFRILYDADSLVNLSEVMPSFSVEKRKAVIAKTFLTAGGRERAAQLFAA
jgi:HD superfamily phosphohydrolase YqeK